MLGYQVPCLVCESVIYQHIIKQWWVASSAAVSPAPLLTPLPNPFMEPKEPPEAVATCAYPAYLIRLYCHDSFLSFSGRCCTSVGRDRRGWQSPLERLCPLPAKKHGLGEVCIDWALCYRAPNAVPQHVYYYLQGHAALDSFLMGYCQPCQKAGARSHLWCSKHHELLDYHAVWAVGFNVACDVDTGKDDYNGVICYGATVSRVADIPPPDHIVNQVCWFPNDWCRLSVSIVHRSEWYPYSLGRVHLRWQMQELLIPLLPYSLTCQGTQNLTSFLILHWMCIIQRVTGLWVASILIAQRINWNFFLT